VPRSVREPGAPAFVSPKGNAGPSTSLRFALDRDSSHLAEQLSLKAFVPVIALSDDAALTSTNVPWIFRMTSESSPAEALRCLLGAEQAAGPNPERIRDALASGRQFAGVRFSSRCEVR
jgi:hypothetical protein